MSASKSTLADFADIEVSKFDLLVLVGEKNVGTFDISVENIHSVEDPQSMDHLDGHPPDLIFRNKFLSLLVSLDESREIST